MRRSTRFFAAIAAVAMATTACGALGSNSIVPTTSSNLGGDRLPVKVVGESYAHQSRPLTGSLVLEANGCWAIDLGDGPRLLVFPEGFAKPRDNGTLMTGPDGTVYTGGMSVDLEGGLIMAANLPGGADGFWGSYVGFCNPERAEVVVADMLEPALDPASLTEEDLVELVRSSQLTQSWGCGFGFEVSSADQTVTVQLYPSEMTPSPGPVTLPDPGWTAQVLVGKHLNTNHCDDVVEGWEPVPTILASWPIISGTLDFALPDDLDCGLAGTVEAVLSGAVVRTPAGDLPLQTLQPINDSFGCFAG